MSESSGVKRAIDANVLIRLLTADHPEQFELVRSLVRTCEEAGDVLFVPLIVLVELAWVLQAKYDVSRDLLLDRIEHLMSARIFEFERETLVARAVDQYRGGPADLADYLIGAIAADAECVETITFDRKLARAAGFRLLISDPS